MSKKYYLKIKIFIKQDANILSNYRFEDHKIELFNDKQISFIQNNKSLLKLKTDVMKNISTNTLEKALLRLTCQQQQY